MLLSQQRHKLNRLQATWISSPHFVDTRLFDEELWRDSRSWPSVDDSFNRNALDSFYVPADHPQLPACGGLLYYVIGDEILGDNQITGVSSKLVPKLWIAVPKLKHAFEAMGLTVLHELGHAMVGLADESVVSEPNPLPFVLNCTTDPGTYFGYGELNLQGCTWPELYRPSNGSLMSYEPPQKQFNVIGCGVLREKFASDEENKLVLDSYFEAYEDVLPPWLIPLVARTHWYDECCAMGGVITPARRLSGDAEYRVFTELSNRKY